MFAHEGIEGNEIVDGMAKGATMEEKDDRIKISASDWRSIIKEEMFEKTRIRVETEGTYKGTTYFNEYYNKEAKKP